MARMKGDRDNALLNKLSHFKRKAWRPITQDGDGRLTISKFAGTPWLSLREQWPSCLRCRRPLQFFLQLNLGELPAVVSGNFGQGLMQLFYCTNDFPPGKAECDDWLPFSPCHLVRLVSPSADTQTIRVPQFEQNLLASSIVRWEEMDDYPGCSECWENGVSLDDQEINLLSDLGYPRPGHKLVGWPFWVQYMSYPACRRCGRRMELVFQLDSDCQRYTFGDVGIGHITQCPEHKDELAFSWACS